MKHIVSGEMDLNESSRKKNKQSLGTVMLKGRAGGTCRLSQLKLIMCEDSQTSPNNNNNDEDLDMKGY